MAGTPTDVGGPASSTLRTPIEEFSEEYPELAQHMSAAAKQGLDSFVLVDPEAIKQVNRINAEAELKQFLLLVMKKMGIYQIDRSEDTLPFVFRRRPEGFQPIYPRRSTSAEEIKENSAEKAESSKDTELSQASAEKQKLKIDYSAAASALQQKATEIEKWIRNNYSTLVASKDLSEEEIQALVGTLIRVGSETEQYPKNRTPSRLYDWAYTRSSITFPYPSLKLASGHVMFDKDFSLKLPWGATEDKFIFPSRESIDDDGTYWGKLYDLITVLGGEVEWNATAGPSVPDIGETELTKNDYFSLVYLRLVELVKSPSSATIRNGAKEKIDIVKNHVDFVVLDLISKGRSEDYGFLPINPLTNQCRRVLTSSKTVSDGKKTKTEIVKSYSGYALAEGLLSYQSGRISKSPEGEPFFKLILKIIKMILSKIDVDYVLPKSLFNPPSSVLRSLLRKGPERKKQKGTVSSVTYVPFSFVKSQECLRMNEVTRKTLTKIGSTISSRIDSVNNLPIKEANKAIPWMEEYVAFCYSTSDQLRKEWQLSGLIVSDLSELSDTFDEDFFALSSENKKIFMDSARSWQIKTIPNYKDAGDQGALVEILRNIQEDKKKTRRKAV
jgi:hypothetical protein